MLLNWEPPEHWQTIKTIDLHVGGEPLRIVLEGQPRFVGETINDLYDDALAHHQTFRKQIVHEPRGHNDMYGAILVSPETTAADFGVIFMDTNDYTPMCGHGIIALTTLLVEADVVTLMSDRSVVKFDTPAGEILAYATKTNDHVSNVQFVGVTSYVKALGWAIDVPEVGEVVVDVAYGGEWYAYVDADEVDLDIVPQNASRFIDLGKRIKFAAMQYTDMPPLYGVIFVQDMQDDTLHSRNVNVYGNGSIDRSPTGTGLCGRLAILHARDVLEQGENIEVASITGATFTGRIFKPTTFEGMPGVIPMIVGRAHIVGHNTFYYDPNDPLRTGFVLR